MEPLGPQKNCTSRPRGRLQRILPLISGVLLTGLVMIFFVVPYWYTGSPESCARCHQMRSYYRSWKTSVHRKTARTCLDCHLKPGLMSLTRYRLTFYREIYATLLSRKPKMSSAVLPPNGMCHRAGCHSLNRTSSIAGDIKIDHRRHVVKARLLCIRCHPGTVHPQAGPKNPPRKMCKRCHEKEMRRCPFCHVVRVKPTEQYEH